MTPILLEGQGAKEHLPSQLPLVALDILWLAVAAWGLAKLHGFGVGSEVLLVAGWLVTFLWGRSIILGVTELAVGKYLESDSRAKFPANRAIRMPLIAGEVVATINRIPAGGKTG